MTLPVYLDYMATTPVDPDVVKAMVACLGQDGVFGNAASTTHVYGQAALEKVKDARQQIASLVNADAREIVWTSGATEAINLAIKGAAQFYHRKGKHIVTVETEHKAVLDTCHFLEREGFDVDYLTPEPNGRLSMDALTKALREDTILVSVMHVNNETGVVQDIEKIGALLSGRGILFHVDAAQSAGKLPIDLQQLNVDLMSFSSHKLYGPKGAGALYVRRTPRVRLREQIHGGGHERGMRSGTTPTHQVVGMGAAFAIAQQRFDQDYQHVLQLRERFWGAISALDDVVLNGDANHTVPGCLNVRFNGIDADVLLSHMHNIAVSTGSACTSANPLPSHVLTAMGLAREQALQSVRFSIGRFTTEADIDRAITCVTEAVIFLRTK